MAYAGIAIMAVMAAMQVMQGVAQSKAAEQNAANADAEAKQAKLTAAAEASRQRRINAAQEAQFRADVGAQGTTFEGSPMEAYLANVKQGELEAQDKLYEGKLKARSYKMEADMYRRQASGALFGGFASGAGTLGSSLLGGTK